MLLWFQEVRNAEIKYEQISFNVPYFNQPVVRSQLVCITGSCCSNHSTCCGRKLHTVRISFEALKLCSTMWNQFLAHGFKNVFILKIIFKNLNFDVERHHHVLWLPDHTTSNKKKKPLILLSSVMRTTDLVFKVHTVLFWVLYMLVCLQWKSSFKALPN